METQIAPRRGENQVNIDGVFFKERDWVEHRVLWAYRFYPDGFMLFTYADPIPPIVLTTAAGKLLCHTQDILGHKSKLPEFLSCFSRQASTPITTRAGIPIVIKSHYEIEGQNISFDHPFFIPEHWMFSGQCEADRIVLKRTSRSTIKGREQRLYTTENLTFLRLN